MNPNENYAIPGQEFESFHSTYSILSIEEIKIEI